MIRTVYDVGDAHVRLQAPEGWVRLGQRGPRLVLHDASCPTPLFVEPLPELDDVDAWILGLASAGKRLTGFQRSSAPDARRFVLTWTSRGTPFERAYRVQRVPSYRMTAGVWVAASIDLDGDRKRYRLLGAVFPHPSPAPQLSGEPGLRPYLEDDQRPTEGERRGPGFTLRLPRFHTIRDVSEHRFLVHVQDEPLAWMTIEGTAKDPAAVVAEMEAWQHARGASVRHLADRAWLVDFPEAAPPSPPARECLLSISLDDAAHVAIRMSGGRTPGDLEEFLRRAHRGFRPWSDQFRGHWQDPAPVSWSDAVAPSPASAPSVPTIAPAPAASPAAPPAPAPRPAPTPSPAPVSALQAEWQSRLSGATLYYSNTGSGGYDPHFSIGGYRESRITLYPTHVVEWDETVQTGATYGIYVGGRTHEHRSGRWVVEIAGTTVQLVLYCGSEGGVHRFELGASGVWLGNRRYTLTKL